MKCAIKATALLIALSAANLAQADIISGSNSDSGSTSGSTSTSTSQGAGSSNNNIGTNSNSSSGSTSGSNSTAIGGGSSRSTSTGGNSRSTSAGGSSNVNVSVTLPTESASATGSGATASSAAAGEPGSSPNNTKATVEYGGTYTVKTVPNIVAPSLTTTLSDTCMGSASFGLSFTGFGATGGTTMVDQACVRRLDSREFRAMGLNDVALALLCQSEANRKAVESTGRSCPGMERAGVPAAPVPPTAASTGVIGQNSINTIGDQYKDPVIRARLGLDKLPELSALKDH
ncbi:MAG: hypothetical protein JWQ61_700 [Collimonas fungivorans]|uniref:hypothetical protein n=1 Tax=Collimonas fungivorans TaxID=158899 RepID=UPI0026F0670D|nr:hypothetical protein [Collimonas fungivorans]MDB5765886.1 hypothetical protein [Collimonas fungivorans]